MEDCTMRYESVYYEPLTADPQKYVSIRDNLPMEIRSALIQDKRLTNYVYVDPHKEGIIEYLDRVFEIGKSDAFMRRVSIEIDEDEIEHFTHLMIAPKDLESDRSVFLEENRPTCNCKAGSEIIGPVKIKVQVAAKHGIAKIFRAWGKPVELVLSAQVRHLFEEAGVTGLTYEPTEFYGVKDSESVPFEPPFLARIVNRIRTQAHRVWLYEDDPVRCAEHSVWNIKHVQYANRRICPRRLTCDDFVEIEGWDVKDQIYNSVTNSFIVTRRVVELLLKHKIKGLDHEAFFLKESKVIPVFFEPPTVGDGIRAIP
jgi:hypothetical protein